MSNILIVSYSNLENKGYRNYERSLKKFGYNYKILGKNGGWQGFMKTKIKNCYNYIKALPDQNQIVCITDVNDIFAIQGPEVLYKKFKEFNKDIVIGSEPYCICFWNCASGQKQRNKNIKRKYVNGGFYMGYAKSICKMYEYMFSLNKDDDQMCLGLYVLNYTNCTIDHTAKIVENTFVDNLIIKNNKIIVKDTKGDPVFLHYPGNNLKKSNKYGKYVFGDLYETYTYFDSLNKSLKTVKNSIKNNIYIQIAILAVIIIIIFLIWWFKFRSSSYSSFSSHRHNRHHNLHHNRKSHHH